MKIRLIGLISIIFLSSCSEYTKVQKGKDPDKKLDMAIRLYEKEQYYKALPLLEELITVFRGTKKAEKTYLYYAFTNYKLGDYASAAYDFENFSKTFPGSEFADSCAYMHAYCYYQDSPEFSLDQLNTYKAINELKLYIDRYPTSNKIDQCNRLIDQLRAKLELKIYENAELYYYTDHFNAAIVTYKNLLHDFPSTMFREQALFKILKASFDYADNSFEEKKKDRYNATLRAHTEFVSAFPESRLRKKADDIAEDATKALARMNSKTLVKK